MYKQFKDVLYSIGLKEQEIKIYLLLLKLQSSTVPELIEKSELNTMMVYRAINDLQEKELIEPLPLNNKQSIYKPLPLYAVAKKLNANQRKMRKLELKIKNLIPFFPYANIENDSEEAIQIREGLDAFREEYLKFPEVCKNEFHHIGNMTNLWKTAKYSYESPEERNFIHKRMSKGIFARVINTPNPDAAEFHAKDFREKRTTKLSEKIPVTNNYLALSENHCSLFICKPEEPQVIVIKQPELLSIQKVFFQNLWSNAY